MRIACQYNTGQKQGEAVQEHTKASRVPDTAGTLNIWSHNPTTESTATCALPGTHMVRWHLGLEGEDTER